jgi:hypothetical protein
VILFQHLLSVGASSDKIQHSLPSLSDPQMTLWFPSSRLGAFFPDLVPDILHVAYNYLPVSVLLFHFADAVVALQLTRSGKFVFARFPASLTSQMR